MFQNRRKYRTMGDEDLVMIYVDKPSNLILEILYKRYAHLVLGLCLKYLKQTQNAEDMCSMIFQKLPDLLLKHDIRYFKSWLYQVSKNECLMQLRKKNPSFSEVNDNILSSDSHATDDKLEKEKEIRKMELALATLKDNQKKCIQLFYLDELSYQEISQQLNMTINSVKSHIQNGKRNLKIVMEAKP